MRCLKLLGLSFIAAMLAGAAAETHPADSTPAPANTKGFSILPPPSVTNVKERTVVATFQMGVDDGFVSNINIIVDPVKTTLAAYMEQALKDLTDAKPGEVLKSRQERKVSGRPAEFLDYEATMQQRRLRFMQLVVVDDDRVFIVTCTAPAGTIAHQKEFQDCIDSFRLEGK